MNNGNENDNVHNAPTPLAFPAAPVVKARRGFAAINPEKLKEISRKGGQAAHALGTAHKFTSEEAREAGKKGGSVRNKQRPNNTENK